MTELYENIYSFVLAAIAAGALHILLPEGMQRTGKFMKYIISLCVVVAVFTQIAKVSDTVSAFGAEDMELMAQNMKEKYENYAELSKKFVITDGVDKAEQSILSTVAGKFLTDEDNLSVEIGIYEENEIIYVDCIKITLGIKAFHIDAQEVEDYISVLYGCDCQVNYK